MSILFLDLEDTIIDSWDNPVLINVGKIKEWIELHSFTEVRLFSFAVHYERDMQTFENFLRKPIETALGITIHPDIFCTDKHHKQIGRFFKECITHNELFTEIGKYRSFLAWCQLHFKGNHCVLLDDAFKNETQLHWDHQTQIDFVQIQNNKPLRLTSSLM